MRKSCQIRGSEIAKKRVCFASFCIIAKTDSQAKKLSEKKRNEAKKRLYISEKANIIIFWQVNCTVGDIEIASLPKKSNKVWRFLSVA
jgi:hypothetical protein